MSTWTCIRSPYTVQQYGYHPNKVALSFDDGPDPKWTPKILDILKNKMSKATFMMIGDEAQENIGLMQRVVREGHEIGNHTYYHPDISEISQRQLDLEVNLTERLFASKLGVQPLYFRPPYDIDEEPDTDDQAAPVVPHPAATDSPSSATRSTPTTGTSIRKTPAEITQSVLDQLNTHEDQAAIPRLHHSAARRRRRPLRQRSLRFRCSSTRCARTATRSCRSRS